MRRARTFELTGALVALVVITAGCVGGSGDPDPLSKTAYLEQADAICREAADDVAQITPPSVSDVMAVEQAIGQLVRIQRRALAELRELRPPEADEPGIDNWLDAVEETLDEMDKVRAALLAGDSGVVAEANLAGAAANDAAEEQAVTYGIQECGGTTAEELTTTTSAP